METKETKLDGKKIDATLSKGGLIRVTGNEWISVESIETLNDNAEGLDIRLKSGRQYRVLVSDREQFFDAYDKAH